MQVPEYQVVIKGTNPNMAIEFHARFDSRYIEEKGNSMILQLCTDSSKSFEW